MKKLPKYFQDIANIIDEKAKQTVFALKCKCGCQNFLIYENIPSKTEQDEWDKWEKLTQKYNGGGYSDKDGNTFLYTKGVAKKSILINKENLPKPIAHIVKIECNECGSTYILYDGRENKKASEKEYTLDNVNFQIKKIGGDNKISLTVKLRYDLSYDEFIDSGLGDSFEKYINNFSAISIYSNNKSGRKRLLYDFEEN